MLLSVCIPTYNRPDDLVNCLSSLAKQKNKKDFEICISDNNSAKKIINIIKPFRKKLNINYKKNKKNIGFAMNVLNVSLMAKGDFIWFLGDDDLVTNNSIKYLSNIIKKNKRVDFFFINSYYLDKSYLNKYSKPFNIKNLPNKMKTHSPVKKNKILNFLELIDHRICFDFLLGFYVNAFRRDLWLKNLNVIDKRLMKKPGTWSTFDNTCFFIKIFCAAFSKSKAFLCAKPLSINLSGVREWSSLYPFVEIVRIPEALDYYRGKGLNFFQYIYSKNYSLRNFFNYFAKIILGGKKMGYEYINFKDHFFKNLIYPNAWLSILYFIFRKIKKYLFSAFPQH
jgi:glycosyltransferase involved in cell wall biosynthesis